MYDQASIFANGSESLAVSASRGQRVSPMDIQWPVTDERMKRTILGDARADQCPEAVWNNMVIVPRQTTAIQQALEERNEWGHEPSAAGNVKQYLAKTAPHYYVQYCAYLTNPDHFLAKAQRTPVPKWRPTKIMDVGEGKKKKKMTVPVNHLADDLQDLLDKFIVIIPMVDPAVVEAHIARLEHKPFCIPVMALDDVLALAPGEGFVQCTCGKYLHYAYCKHALGWALKKNLISFHGLRAQNPTRLRKRGARGGARKKSGRSLSRMTNKGPGFDTHNK